MFASKSMQRGVTAYFSIFFVLFQILGVTAAIAADSAIGLSLENAGITPKASFVGEFAANPSGGIHQGETFVGQISGGLDFDMSRLADIPGGTFHINMADRFGRDLSKDDIGNSIDVQELFGGGMNPRLAEFSWEQDLFAGKVNIKAGRVDATPDFVAFSSIGCSFQTNATCPVPKLIGRDSNAPIWPDATWGGRVRVWASDSVYIQVGAYDVDPLQGSHTQNGTDWQTGGSTGTFVPFELGYATSFKNDSMPRHYKLGGYYDGADYTDPSRDSSGALAAATGKPYATLNGRSGLYGWADQMIWRPDLTSEKGLTIFGSLLAATSGRNSESFGLETGAILKGTFPGRDADTAGFVITDQHLSSGAMDNLRLLRTHAGGTEALAADEVIIEVNYGIAVLPGLSVMPNLQYIINPDALNTPSRTTNIPNTFVVGLKFVSDFPKLFGL